MNVHEPVGELLLSQARHDAAGAAEQTGVQIVTAQGADDCRRVADLLDQVWQVPSDHDVLDVSTLVGFTHSGCYVAMACDAASQVVIAASVGFFGPPGTPLHSHIAGVVPGGAGRGVGRALKLHQRAWSLERGVDQITWTYDPLVARNAWFNLITLGARADAYYPDHYGVMTDGLNAGQASDRMLIRWDLRRAPSPADPIAGARHTVLADIEDRPGPVDVEVPADCGAAQIAVPGDIEALRISDRDLAIAWRQATRAAFVPLLAAGWQVTGIERPARYLLTRAHRSEPTDQEHR